MRHDEQPLQSNPWKLATIAILSAVTAALVSGVVVAQVHEAKDAEAAADSPPELDVGAMTEPEPEPAKVVAGAQAQPAPRPAVYRENCDKYAWAADRRGRHVARDGVMGAAVGAGLGAAGGAIASGGSGAGKGAGIGAIVGLAGGTLYGVNQENQRTQAARNAYHACLARQRG
ncbi:MAG: hypothetical protein JRH16_14245 [Deltaproteobacteria bacterium]|nr:hypothetical protein [Deltaproteobacteria bacterium]